MSNRGHRTEEQRLDRLERMIEEIHAFLLMGGMSNQEPGEVEYRRAILEMRLHRNTEALAQYLKRGGKIRDVKQW